MHIFAISMSNPGEGFILFAPDQKCVGKIFSHIEVQFLGGELVHSYFIFLVHMIKKGSGKVEVIQAIV